MTKQDIRHHELRAIAEYCIDAARRHNADVYDLAAANEVRSDDEFFTVCHMIFESRITRDATNRVLEYCFSVDRKRDNSPVA